MYIRHLASRVMYPTLPQLTKIHWKSQVLTMPINTTGNHGNVTPVES